MVIIVKENNINKKTKSSSRTADKASKRLCVHLAAVLFVFIMIIRNMVMVPVIAQEENLDSLYAKSAALIDGNTGRLLYGKEADTELAMASTTKIMTCILVLENMELESICTASAYAASQPKVRLGVQTGWEFTCNDLLYSLMLESHNDTAVILAESVAGSVEEFAVLMNKKATQIGLKQTHFVTPNGLDANGHYTTARELAQLMRYCIRISPERETFLSITESTSHTFTDISGKRTFSVYNHNAFLQMMEGALTGKTGFTGNAGYCYVGALERDGKLYIVALLACGWPQNKTYKWSDTKKLMNYGINQYDTKMLKTPDIPYIEANVENGIYNRSTSKCAKVALVCPEAPQNIEVLAKKGEKIEIKIRASLELKAPLYGNEVCGEVSYWLGEVCLGIYDIYPQNPIEKQTFFWYIKNVLSMLI